MKWLLCLFSFSILASDLNRERLKEELALFDEPALKRVLKKEKTQPLKETSLESLYFSDQAQVSASSRKREK